MASLSLQGRFSLTLRFPLLDIGYKAGLFLSKWSHYWWSLGVNDYRYHWAHGPTIHCKEQACTFLSRWRHSHDFLYFLVARSEFFQALTAHKALIKKDNRARMFLRHDRVGENTSAALFYFSLEQVMKMEFPAPNASQSSGGAERLIQEL